VHLKVHHELRLPHADSDEVKAHGEVARNWGVLARRHVAVWLRDLAAVVVVSESDWVREGEKFYEGREPSTVATESESILVVQEEGVVVDMVRALYGRSLGRQSTPLQEGFEIIVSASFTQASSKPSNMNLLCINRWRH
jgi:hypothetical protein